MNIYYSGNIDNYFDGLILILQLFNANNGVNVIFIAVYNYLFHFTFFQLFFRIF